MQQRWECFRIRNRNVALQGKILTEKKEGTAIVVIVKKLKGIR